MSAYISSNLCIFDIIGMDGKGFKVRPKKGSAVLFYNLLEDGNGDDLALHAALPCTEGDIHLYVYMLIHKCKFICIC